MGDKEKVEGYKAIQLGGFVLFIGGAIGLLIPSNLITSVVFGISFFSGILMVLVGSAGELYYKGKLGIYKSQYAVSTKHIFCRFCGKNIPEDAIFCPQCGRRQ